MIAVAVVVYHFILLWECDGGDLLMCRLEISTNLAGKNTVQRARERLLWQQCFLSTTFSQNALLQRAVVGDFLADTAAVTSPVAVDFRGLVARQSPHVIDGQAGRPVGLERQRGEPVQGHEGEEAGVVDGVLVPGNQWGEEKKREGGVRKGQAVSERRGLSRRFTGSEKGEA